MITGVHAILFTRDAEGVREFLRDVLELQSVDAGGGWLIFGLPPAELAAHPGEEAAHAALPDVRRHRGDDGRAARRRASS